MNAWEIHTFGGGEYLVDLFNGIAALTRGNSYLNVIKTSAVFGLIWALMQSAFGGNFRSSFNWLVSFVIIFNVLFVPKSTVIIHDPLNRERPYSTVNNVPYALAVFASLSSSVGKELTEQMEMAFTPIDYLPYNQHGLVFGNRMASTAVSMKIIDENFAASINSFMKQCVFYDLLLRKYTLNELKHTDDIWNFLTVENSASPARSFVLMENNTQQIMTCRDGVSKLNSKWNGEINEVATVFGKFLYPSYSNHQAKQMLLQNLPISFSALSNSVANNATEIIKQNLLINAIDRAGADFSNIGANANIYTEIRSKQQTRNAFNASKSQAEEWLPILRTVLEILFYGAFPLIAMLAVLPIGAHVIRGYFATFIWLQAWAPLYAILNMVMSKYTNLRLSGVSDYGLTLATQSGIASINQSIGEMAGYLAWFIPFIAAGLTKGMVSITGLATSMLAVPQSAANQAANEVSTGNISLGNVNLDNANYGNISANKINDSAFFDSARVQSLNHAGGVTTIAPDGHTVYDQSNTVSRIPNLQISSNDTASLSASQNASVYQNMGDSLSRQAAESKAKSMDQVAQYIASHSINENHGLKFAEHASADVREAYSRIEQEANELARNNNIDKTTAFSSVLSGNLGFGSGGNYGSKNSKGSKALSSPLGFLGFSGGANLSLEGRASATSSETFSNAERTSSQNSLQHDISLIKNAIKDGTLEFHDSRGNTLNDTINQSFAESERLENQSRIYYDTAKSFSTQSQLLKSQSISVNSDKTQEFIEYAKSYKDINGNPLGEKALQIIANDSAAANRLRESFVSQNGVGNIQNNFLSTVQDMGTNNLSNEYHSKEADYQNKHISNDNNMISRKFEKATEGKSIDNSYLKGSIESQIQAQNSNLDQKQIDAKDLKFEVNNKLKVKKPSLSNFDNNEE